MKSDWLTAMMMAMAAEQSQGNSFVFTKELSDEEVEEKLRAIREKRHEKRFGNMDVISKVDIPFLRIKTELIQEVKYEMI